MKFDYEKRIEELERELAEAGLSLLTARGDCEELSRQVAMAEEARMAALDRLAEANVCERENFRRAETNLARAEAAERELAKLHDAAQRMVEEYAMEFRAGPDCVGEGWTDGFRANESPDREFLALRDAVAAIPPPNVYTQEELDAADRRAEARHAKLNIDPLPTNVTEPPPGPNECVHCLGVIKMTEQYVVGPGGKAHADCDMAVPKHASVFECTARRGAP